MGKLQINLGPRSEKLWEDMKSREEFEFMPQEGIFVAMMRSYNTANPSNHTTSTCKTIVREKTQAELDAEMRDELAKLVDS